MLVNTATNQIIHDDEEGESSDDEEEDDAPRQQDMLMKLQNTIANESRDALKTRLRGMGALLPADKFKKPDVQSDEFLRQWIIDVFTGKVAPAMIVAPDELPPF